jgi:hypothetical protein
MVRWLRGAGQLHALLITGCFISVGSHIPLGWGSLAGHACLANIRTPWVTGLRKHASLLGVK